MPSSAGKKNMQSPRGRWCSGSLRRASPRSAEREADLQGHLVMGDLAALDMAASLLDLEPANVAHGRGGAGDGALDRILDAGRRAADDLDHLVDIVAHR